jgi:N-acetylglutamate synthase-like GNAT family acetyltransferase
MNAVTVRSARLEDVDHLARLFDQLGYPQTAGALHNRLESLLADARAGVLVADSSGSLVGVATYFLVPVAHDDRSWSRITTLVVDEAHRGRGIGHMLVEAAQNAARNASCSRIEATSAMHRADAHGFYQSLGYGRTSAHFLKRL